MEFLLYVLGGVGLLSIGIVPFRVWQLSGAWMRQMKDKNGSYRFIKFLAFLSLIAIFGLDLVVFAKVARCLTSAYCGPGVASGWIYLAVLGAAYILMELALLLGGFMCGRRRACA